MRKIFPLLLALSLLLTGCSWLDGSNVSVTPHREQRPSSQPDVISAANYQELVDALAQLIAAGKESAAIQVTDYPADTLEDATAQAARHVKYADPIGAYAVENITCEIGTSGGLPAVAVTITYRRSITQIQRIRRVENMDNVEALMAEALEGFNANTVVLVENYSVRDFTQFVQNYASEHPQTVMETPQVTESVYGSGEARVVELIYTYQNSRDALRQMRSQVEPVFNSAVLYVSGEGADRQKYAQLYAFLMERFDYTNKTSITPAYSLLRHGVGDSRAFATVYAAMCRGAGLTCMTVTGTYAGEPRTWNLVQEGDYYYHVDLLRCSELGGYRAFTDAAMEGYVWDYSAYPACTGAPTAPETAPVEEQPPETETSTEPEIEPEAATIEKTEEK